MVRAPMWLASSTSACSSSSIASRRWPRSNARCARSSAVGRSRTRGVRTGATAASVSAIENTLTRVERLEHREGDHDDEPTSDAPNVASPPYLDGPAEPRGHELELGVAERAHLGQVEPLELDVDAHALADEEVDEGVEDVGEGEDHPHQRAHADQLGHELARVTVEEPRDRAVHSVPAPAVVAGAVREEADAQHAPQAAGPVHRGRAHRIVDLHDPLEELDAQADEHAGREADDGGADGVDEAAGRGDRDQAR